MHKIKKGDLVKVITGKDKDKTGKVLSVNVKKNTGNCQVTINFTPQTSGST